MVAAIVDHGLPFMHEYATLPALQGLLSGGFAGPPHKVDFRLPAVSLLLGDWSAATEAVDRVLREHEGQDDLWMRQYRSFAAEVHAFASRGGDR